MGTNSASYTFVSHIDPEKRVKSFVFERDEQKEQRIKERCEQLQEIVHAFTGICGWIELERFRMSYAVNQDGSNIYRPIRLQFRRGSNPVQAIVSRITEFGDFIVN